MSLIPYVYFGIRMIVRVVETKTVSLDQVQTFSESEQWGVSRKVVVIANSKQLCDFRPSQVLASLCL